MRKERLALDAEIVATTINLSSFLPCSLHTFYEHIAGIFWQFGLGVEFLICLILTFCGYFPGVFYACIMIATDK